jgi:hypothetical protein
MFHNWPVFKSNRFTLRPIAYKGYKCGAGCWIDYMPSVMHCWGCAAKQHDDDDDVSGGCGCIGGGGDVDMLRNLHKMMP